MTKYLISNVFGAQIRFLKHNNKKARDPGMACEAEKYRFMECIVAAEGRTSKKGLNSDEIHN